MILSYLGVHWAGVDRARRRRMLRYTRSVHVLGNISMQTMVRLSMMMLIVSMGRVMLRH